MRNRLDRRTGCDHIAITSDVTYYKIFSFQLKSSFVVTNE